MRSGNLTSKSVGSEELDFRLHADWWSELGDGGRRYRSCAREQLFPASVANAEKVRTESDLDQDNDREGSSQES